MAMRRDMVILMAATIIAKVITVDMAIRKKQMGIIKKNRAQSKDCQTNLIELL
jgi:hypothetical protein